MVRGRDPENVTRSGANWSPGLQTEVRAKARRSGKWGKLKRQC